MDIDLISVTEAMKIMNLSQSQVLVLCNKGRIDAKKVGKTWVILRSSAESYKPAPQGFAAVWEKRRAREAELNKEIEAALDEAKNRKVKE